VCAYHCAQLSYTTQHSAVLIIFALMSYPLDKHQSSDAVYWRGGAFYMCVKTAGIEETFHNCFSNTQTSSLIQSTFTVV